MLINYLKIAFRNILRHKIYSFINIAGFAIGMACCILILLFVQDELKYDRHHEKGGQIYRVSNGGVLGGNKGYVPLSPAPLAATVVNDYPEVITAARFRNLGFPVVRYGDKAFSEERWFYADSTAFDVFTIPFISGNPKTALNGPLKVVLTESMAKKYFGDENPIGEILRFNDEIDLTITGIIENPPGGAPPATGIGSEKMPGFIWNAWLEILPI